MQKNSVNKVILIGNLGQDPESRFTPQGTAVTSFSVATNESWKSQSGEIKEHTEWHRIEMFGKRAETANEYMRKGHTVYIEGRLKTDEWEDKETGQKRRATKIQCDNFTMLGRRGDGQNQGAGQPSAPASNEDDDLPF
jgi:single-strand DNA-binding protein